MKCAIDDRPSPMFLNSDVHAGKLRPDRSRLVTTTSKLAFELQSVWGVATTKFVTTQVVNVLVSEVEAGEYDEFLLQQYAVEAGVRAHQDFVELLTTVRTDSVFLRAHRADQCALKG